jgi:hypothetical protein
MSVIKDQPKTNSRMQRRCYVLTLFVLTCITYARPVFSQEIFFNKITLPDEAVNRLVSGITQDLQGNIWVGTYGSGLDKYNQKTGNFTHYKHDEKDIGSLSGDSVTCIFEDRDGFKEGEGTEFSILLPGITRF